MLLSPDLQNFTGIIITLDTVYIFSICVTQKLTTRKKWTELLRKVYKAALILLVSRGYCVDRFIICLNV